MFPESNLAIEFWYFVRGRAIDPRNGGPLRRTGSDALDRVDEHATMRYELECETRVNDNDLPYFNDDPGYPWTYATIQEALVAFLIDRATEGDFPYTYRIWLRTIILIMSDIQRDSGWLELIAQDETGEMGDKPAAERQQRHTMKVSDDWSCLSCDTFDFILRTYGKEG